MVSLVAVWTRLTTSVQGRVAELFRQHRRSTLGGHTRRFSHRSSRFGQAAEILEDRCLLATFVVNDDGGADFTTIQAAINDAGTVAGDIIQITGGLDGIHTEDDISINKDLTLEGVNGATQVIVQAASTVAMATDGVFAVTLGTTATIDNLTIRNGRSGDFGGGIFNNGTLTLTNATVSGNSAGFDGGGIFNDGTLTLTNATVSGNSATAGGGIRNDGMLTLTNATVSGNSAVAGGGIFNNGTLTLTNATVSGNSAGNFGGGIENFGTLTVTNSTISGNSAGLDGGGIDTDGGTVTLTNSTISGNFAGRDGGGIYNNDGTLTVTNSTISGNSAGRDGGGIYNNDEAVTVVNSTIVNNRADADGNGTGTGGGIWTFNDGVTFTTLFNSIVAGNLSNATANDLANKPVEAASANNLIGDAASAGGLTDGMNGNVVGVDPATVLNLTLADNGGPTLTHALVPGSAALNAGDNAQALDPQGNPLTFDQRGQDFDRLVNGTVDIGAFEVQPAMTFVVDTLVDESDGNFDLGDLSLREAIERANQNVGVADTITFDATVFAVGMLNVITLGGTQLTITDDVTITGLGADRIAVDGNQLSRVLEVTPATTVTIDGLTIRNGNAIVGGGIANVGTLTLTNSTVSGNSANRDGGGIVNVGTLTLTNSTVSGNSAEFGGGIVNVGTLTLTNSTVSGNSANNDGGGVLNFDGTVIVINSTLVNNRADANGNGVGTGGGIFTINDGQTFTTLFNTIVAGNLSNATANDLAEKNVEADSANNLIGNAASAGGLMDGVMSNVVGVDPATVLNLTLADNGGPTLTHALVPGSAALNTGDNAQADDAQGNPLAFDQRGTGFDRIVGGTVDIGAFESEVPILLSIANVTLAEGTSTTMTPTAFTFTVTLDQAIDQDLTFDFTTVADTALAGSDFTAISGQGMIMAGDTMTTITVNVVADDEIELPERFFVDLSNLQAGGRNVEFDNPRATGTIQNDETLAVRPVNPGAEPRVQVVHAVTKRMLAEILVFDPGFLGGVSVAVGDVNGDGVLDVIAAANAGGGPHVRTFDGLTLPSAGLDPSGDLANFFAFTINFLGGVSVAAGDVNGDGRDDVIVGAGPGGGPHVRAFNGMNLPTGGQETALDPFPADDLANFFVFDLNFRGGVSVAAGDVNGDGRDDVIVGAGPGGGPHVRVFNGMSLRTDGMRLLNPNGDLANFMALDVRFLGGVSVAVGDVNNDGRVDVIAGASLPTDEIANFPSITGISVRVFNGMTLPTDGLEIFDTPNNLTNFFFSNEFVDGISVSSEELNQDGFDDVIVFPRGTQMVRAFSVAGGNAVELPNPFLPPPLPLLFVPTLNPTAGEMSSALEDAFAEDSFLNVLLGTDPTE